MRGFVMDMERRWGSRQEVHSELRKVEQQGERIVLEKQKIEDDIKKAQDILDSMISGNIDDEIKEINHLRLNISDSIKAKSDEVRESIRKAAAELGQFHKTALEGEANAKDNIMVLQRLNDRQHLQEYKVAERALQASVQDYRNITDTASSALEKLGKDGEPPIGTTLTSPVIGSGPDKTKEKRVSTMVSASDKMVNAANSFISHSAEIGDCLTGAAITFTFGIAATTAGIKKAIGTGRKLFSKS